MGSRQWLRRLQPWPYPCRRRRSVRSRPLIQRLITAYEASGKREGKIAMYKLLRSVRPGVPKELSELAQLGQSLWKRHREILAYFDVGASNGPVEAINRRLEHLRGIALGFRNLKHYILRSLLHSGPLQTRINAL